LTGEDQSPELKPKAGDIMLCTKCGQPSKYTDNMQMTKLTMEDWIEIREESPKEYQMIKNAPVLISQFKKAIGQ